MGAFLVIFFPGVIGAGVHMLIKNTAGKRPDAKTAIFAWCCYTLAINLCIRFVKSAQGWGELGYVESLSGTSNFLKYGAFAVVLAVLLAALWNLRTVWPLLRRKCGALAKKSAPAPPLRDEPDPLTRGDLAKFIAASVLAALFALFYWGHVRYKTLDFNMGTLIFSYRYGFVCRALIGTLLEAAARLLGTELSAAFVNRFSLLSLIVLVAAVIWFLCAAARRTERLFGGAAARAVLVAGVFFEIGVGFSTFFVDWGRTDLYMLVLSLLACWLLAVRKWPFAAVLIAAVCALIHEGYLFMYANILFVTLAYRALCAWEERPRAAVKYAAALLLSLGAAAGLFVYFYFFAKPVGGLKYISVFKHTLDVIEKPSDYMIDAIYAIQNQLFGNRWTYAGAEVMRERRRYLLPILLAFSPFIAVFFAYWRIALKRAASSGLSRLRRAFYWLVPFGSVTALPLFLLHMDYWRWYYQICFYELFIVLTLVASGDEVMADSLRELFDRIKKVRYLPAALAVYAAVLGPFWNDGFTLTKYITSGIEAIKGLF